MLKKFLLAVLLLSGVMFGQTPIASDNFDRADSSTTLGANWSKISGTWGISGNQAYVPANTNANYTVAWWSGAGTFSADHCSEATIAAGAGVWAGVTVRSSGTTSSTGKFYGFRYDNTTTHTFILEKYTSSTLTTLSSAAVSGSSAVTLKLCAIGSSLIPYVNGSLWANGVITDAGITAGVPGIRGAGSGIRIDNWSGYAAVNQVTVLPASGSYFGQQSVTISCLGGTPYYTTDGSTPTTSSTLYAGAFNTSSSGTQTVKAFCSLSGNDSAVASNAYSIAPSDTAASITDNFSPYYDSNLAVNHVQQFPLDTVPTKGKWKAVGPLTGINLGSDEYTDHAIAPMRPAVRAAVTSGYAVATFSSELVIAANTSRTGLANDQWAEVKIPANGYGGVALRCALDGTKNCYYARVQQYDGSGGGTLTIGKLVAGSNTTIASVGGITGITGQPLRFRVAGSSLQVLINGSVPSGAATSYTDTSLTSGTCGVAVYGNGGVSDFSCGNIGVADGTSANTYTPTNPTYTDAAMSTSSWTMGWPWVQAAVPTAPAGTNFWTSTFAPYLVTGSTYGIGLSGFGAGTMAYRGGEFGSNQWQRFKTAADPDNANFNNYFAPMQHQTYVPGSSGGCAAAGTSTHCFDSVSIYPGVETMLQQIGARGVPTVCGGGTKAEYVCTPHAHVTFVSPTSTDDAVITGGGSTWAVRKGDEWFVQFVNGYVSVACKGNVSNEVVWQASHAYTVGTWILDYNRVWQRVKTAGTSSGTTPVFYAGWNSVTSSGDTTTDGTVTWESYGNACATTDKFSWVAGITNIYLPDFIGQPGIPALWSGQVDSTPIFYDWSAGTATTSTACTLDSNLCVIGGKRKNRVNW